MKFSSRGEGKEMHFLDHLEALRWHLVRSAAAIFVFALIAFLNKELIFDGIILAPKNSNFWTYRVLCELSQKFNLDMCFDRIDFKVVNLSISGQFTTHMWIAFMAGFIMAFPYFIWEIWRFIKPALSDKELKYSRGIVFFTTLLFVLGLLFGYYLITPMSISFLGNYQVSAEVSNTISLDSYINIVTVMSLSTGLVFELPMIIYFLSKLGIVTPKFMRQYRKHAMVINLILAAVITPSPDVTSQMLVAIPLFILYEISIYVSMMVERGKKEVAA
ncbi:twin-arginine translocase subunit TatC [soil metagenome]